MGREVRMVPENWEHPKSDKGNFIPLLDNYGNFEECDKEWMEGWRKWQLGLCQSYGSEMEWKPIKKEYLNTRYTDYVGDRPNPDDYMPNWPESERTHLMMYENTSEGTPISPAFKSAEELARWLADNKASAFADMTATYEQWLSTCQSGSAISMVISNEGMKSGVEALA
ncbi:hypothetical protein MLD52_09075 [Puniceicoccaceae bacterium K14]|nr:hypothetical protein [Puniceicoccaceae bacterium K14]